MLLYCNSVRILYGNGVIKRAFRFLTQQQINYRFNNRIVTHFRGEKIRYLNPDERSTAALIRNGLVKYKNQNKALETSPGVTLEKIGLEEILMRLPNPVLLNENGNDEIKNSGTFILGDDKDPTETEMLILNKLPKINLGNESLLSSACITLIHHRLDEK